MNKRPLFLYVAGQGVSNLGDAIRFIAVTVLLFKITGSGVSTSLSMFFSVLPSILLSPVAGALGDMFSEKYMLSIIDLVRCAAVFFFISETNTVHIYLLLVLLAGLDMFYAPARRKFILSIAGRNGVLKANSLLTGVSGAAYLAGPLVSAFLTVNVGYGTAFSVNAATYFMSALITLSIRIPDAGSIKNKISSAKRSITGEIVKGCAYIQKSPRVKEVIFTGLVASLCSISINLAFYPLAFEQLKVTTEGWSLMISVYYGTNLLAMSLMELLKDKPADFLWGILHKGLLAASLIWFMYSTANSFEATLLLQFIEGTVLAVCSILIASRMQTVSQRSFLARVGGVNDILSSLGKLAGMGLSYFLLFLGSCRSVFLVISLIMALFSIYGLLSDHGWRYRRVQ